MPQPLLSPSMSTQCLQLPSAAQLCALSEQLSLFEPLDTNTSFSGLSDLENAMSLSTWVPQG